MNQHAEQSPPVRLLEEIGMMGSALRAPLQSLLEEIGGSPPRPARLIRTIGLDKSLASRLVRAARAESDLEFMHLVPSPTGLRIFASQSRGTGARTELARLDAAIDRFQQLLDATPGGRDAIESLVSESSHDIRERREHIAKQATFKSMSFLLGHYCETLATSLFLVPSRHGRTVDGIEVQQRIGLRRLRPSSPLSLLSIVTPPEDEPPDDSTWIETLDGGLGTLAPQEFLLPSFCTEPPPEIEVIVNGPMTTFMLAGVPDLRSPSRIASAFRIRNGWTRVPSSNPQPIRGYVLHMPCRAVIRDVFVAEGLFDGGIPRIRFRLPTPGGFASSELDVERRHPGAIDLVAPIEQLPAGSRAFELTGVPGNRALIEHALARTGQADTKFRGWRCSLTYPVPLIEMFWLLELPGARELHTIHFNSKVE